MVSKKLFESYPPFPDDIPIANVSRISFAKLVTGDESERTQLFEACRTLGFFLLDLSNEPAGMKFIQTICAVFEISKKTFDLSYEEKAKYNVVPPQKLYGYKPLGVMKIETGQPDRCEFFTIGQDDLLGNGPARENPQVIEESRETMVSYLEHAVPIVETILNILEIKLGLPSRILSSLQRQDQSSGTNIRMIRYPPQLESDRRTSFRPHTDFGTLTLLSNVLGGLQILESDSASKEPTWRYIKPEPNCIIVNIADAFVEWTGGILRSNLHRVTFAPGAQANCTRYSIAYLIRPEQNASMKRLVGKFIPTAEEDGAEEVDLTALEWEKKMSLVMLNTVEAIQSKGGKEPKKISAEFSPITSY